MYQGANNKKHDEKAHNAIGPTQKKEEAAGDASSKNITAAPANKCNSKIRSRKKSQKLNISYSTVTSLDEQLYDGAMTGAEPSASEKHVKDVKN
ncbi:hypothetical protein TruAng_008016 [Truncatella angustata]|nr:hypothetical protein TruAng_008016 [Truncatella angustata]